jgi:hypothetical protein
MNYFLLTRATNVLIAWPRDDSEPVIGLDRNAYHVVEAIQEPEPTGFNPATHGTQPLAPVVSITDVDADVNGTVTYGWEVVELPPGPEPGPDWPGFRQAILTENGYLAAMARARDSQDDAAWAAVTFSLSRLDRFQDKGDFSEYLQGLLLIVSVQPEQEKGPLIQEFLDLAVRCNLPTAFITALNQAIIAMTPPSP